MDVTDVQPETKAQFEAEEEIVKERDERLPSTVDRGNGRPFKRGKIAVLWFVSCSFLSLGLCFILIRSTGWPLYLFLIYLAYMFLFQEFQFTGGMPMTFIRTAFIWRWFCEYFPIEVVKTADLDPKENYLFGYHPHGIIGMGAFGTFATECTTFPKLFPGIKPRLLTLDVNFRIPFYSFYLALLGLCSAGKRSCLHILTKLGPGNSIVLVLGGAKESLDAHPGIFDLTIKHRKGFVKVALRAGAHLVPCFGFGENEIYDQVENPRGSSLRKWQNWAQKILGFALPLVKGEGFFIKYGLLPYPKPIRVVIGRPIPVPKTDEEKITQALIDEYHEKYLKGLVEIYNNNKMVYALHRRKSLEFF